MCVWVYSRGPPFSYPAWCTFNSSAAGALVECLAVFLRLKGRTNVSLLFPFWLLIGGVDFKSSVYDWYDYSRARRLELFFLLPFLFIQSGYYHHLPTSRIGNRLQILKILKVNSPCCAIENVISFWLAKLINGDDRGREKANTGRRLTRKIIRKSREKLTVRTLSSSVVQVDDCHDNMTLYEAVLSCQLNEPPCQPLSLGREVN
jgi:hypothetical protein